jgi:uncharacterized protein YkwD
MLLRASILLSVVAVALMTSAVAPSAKAGQKRASARTSVTRATSLEGRLIRQINLVRAARGLHRLTRSSALSRTAVGHSVAMATQGFFTHESADGKPFWNRVEQAYTRHTRGWTVGENLAMFGGAPPSAAGIVQAWLASPPHRANLLRPIFREAGVGIVFNPAAGGVFGGAPTWVVTLDVGRR